MKNSYRQSISSCWNSARHTDGFAMIEELAELGFSRVELSHGIRVSLIPGILKALEEGLVEVGSVHNFCPLPSGVQHAAPNFYQPSSPREGERNLWINYTLKTLEFAQTVQAEKVIMHSGSAVFFLGNPFKKAEALQQQWLQTAQSLEELRQDPAFSKARDRGLKKILKKEDKAAPRMTEVFQPVVEAAAEKRLQLCIENREGLTEFPSDERIPQFLEALGDPATVCYWHDTGHAQIKHFQGVQDHVAYLEANSGRLAGFHLHDVSSEGRDHCPLGTGTINWKALRPYMKPEHLFVLELSPRVGRQEVLDSKAFLEDLLNS